MRMSVHQSGNNGHARRINHFSIFCNQVGAEGGQELVEYTLAKLNELKEKDEV